MKAVTKLFAVLCLTVPVLAFAQTSPAPRDPLTTPRIDKRQVNQENRIQQGVQSGQLTDREAARLEKGQTRIQDMKTQAAADGKVTGAERARIQRAQEVQSRRIYRQKHDRQRR